MTSNTAEEIRGSTVVMGANDADHCADGWLPVEAWGEAGEPVRWVSGQARVFLKAPDDAWHVGIQLWTPKSWRAPRVTARLTVRDSWVGKLPGYQPFLDVGFWIEPGTWQTVEFPLHVRPPAGSDVEIIISVDRPAPRWRTRAASEEPERNAAVRRIWLRGNRLEPDEVTIIVLNWNRAEETVSCLESLRQADLRGASVLVVDNGSKDDSVAAIRARFPAQRIIALPENRGYSGGNNAGIRAALEAGAKAVMILNNDTKVAPDFLEPLLWVLNSDVKAAAVSSGLRRSDYPEVLESAYLEIYFGHGIILHYGVNKLPGEGFDYRREVEVVVGCSVLLSADALRDIGLLDESYFAYHEEVDWCFRARAAGYRIYWQPYSRVWHSKSTSTLALARPVRGIRTMVSGPQLPATMPLPWNPVQTYLGARNAVRFIRRHANLRQKLYFAFSSLYGVPLEFLAAVMRQEPALKIGAWSYAKALRLYCSDLDAIARGTQPPVTALRMLLHVPFVLLWALPRDIRIAHRDGRLAQVGEQARGLWDGLLNRELPLERLGLR